MTDQSDGAPPEEPQRPEHRLERVERAKGRLPGDARVKIVRNSEFRRRRGYVMSTERALESRTPIGRAMDKVRGVLFGHRLRTEEEGEERVSNITGLAIFASDNISSSAYATEETMRTLALAGTAALALTMPITVAILVVLAIVVTSYLQVIKAYPNGGGGYIVARENLGTLAGLIAAAALLIDYFLTVSVSVAGGLLAITTALPELDPIKVELGVAFIVLITLGNLRGIREAGVVFAGPTYFYAASVLGILAIGFFRILTGDVPTPVAPPAVLEGGEALGAFLILRAFASGSVGLTGTEAVADGITAFRKPEARNGSIVLISMAILFATLFFGISYLATHLGIQVDATETKSVLGLLAQSIVGQGIYFYVLQASTAVILILAANTSFSGFPRLASILAAHRYLPRQFAQRGDRLAFSFGIIALAIVATLLLVGFKASVSGLIPLYTIGVFIAFTLSQAGLVRRWWRMRERGWRIRIVVNGLGTVVTAVVTVVVAATKFALGAWMVLAILPVIVFLMWQVNKHYRRVEAELTISRTTRMSLGTRRARIIVPVSRVDRSALEALSVASGLVGDVSALHISFDEEGAVAFKERWARIGTDVPLEIIVSPYRAITRPLINYLNAIDDGDTARPVVVVLAEFVPRHWWDTVLHNQTALRLKLDLFTRPNTAVIDVPHHLDDLEDGL
ncbi:MAG: APC family permease [Chloroflexota bacterium]